MMVNCDRELCCYSVMCVVVWLFLFWLMFVLILVCVLVYVYVCDLLYVMNDVVIFVVGVEGVFVLCVCFECEMMDV